MAHKKLEKLFRDQELHHLSVAQIELRMSEFMATTRRLRFQLATACLVGFVGLAFVSGFLYAFLTANPALHASIAGESVTGNSWQTKIDSLDVSNKTKIVTLVTRDGETETTLLDAGAGIDVTATKQLVENGELQRKLYPWKLLKVNDYSPIVSIDAKQLNDLLKRQNLIKQTPVDARVELKDGEFVVVPGVDGWQADINALSEQLSTVVLSELTNNRIEVPVRYSSPRITTAAAEQAKKQADELVATTVAASYLDQTLTVPKNEQQQWVTFAPNQSDGSLRVSYDASAVGKSVDSFVTGLTVTKRDQLVYHMLDGAVIVSITGVNGRSVTNKEDIKAAWLTGIPVKVAFVEEAFGTADGGVLSKSIIVDLSAFTATAYEDGKAVMSFPISGGKPSTPTPTGTYSIYAKTRKQTMTGPGYSTPNIEWISWFYPDYALHGAYWHNDFGYANVSHGCVNMRNVDAQWIFNWAPVGTPVVVRQD